MSDLPVFAHVSGKGKVTYVYDDGRTVTLHGPHPGKPTFEPILPPWGSSSPLTAAP